tara:strand:+ start:90 stop:512 length:423 start_codon:yes stop_codon:yes gene_type:complete
MKQKKEILIFVVSFLIFIAVTSLLFYLFNLLDVKTTRWRDGEEVGNYLSAYSFFIGILSAFKAFWLLDSFHKDKEYKSYNLCWRYLFFGSSILALILYLGSLINIKPLILEQALAFAVCIIFPAFAYINYKAKADKLNDT